MTKTHDPKGLVREAYRIEGITAGECRTIFLDWALGLPDGTEAKQAVHALLVAYADQPADHPMTQTLVAALKDAPAPRRRGGRTARLG
ncbi:hypothetical protein [Yoonia sp. 2307UL14-13]|uniref:hypothetical protein n=1 Tax=Yoonia sp. 2307UL14-13 TaxID=3126506 RepID=UPI00309F58D5